MLYFLCQNVYLMRYSSYILHYSSWIDWIEAELNRLFLWLCFVLCLFSCARFNTLATKASTKYIQSIQNYLYIFKNTLYVYVCTCICNMYAHTTKMPSCLLSERICVKMEKWKCFAMLLCNVISIELTKLSV